MPSFLTFMGYQPSNLQIVLDVFFIITNGSRGCSQILNPEMTHLSIFETTHANEVNFWVQPYNENVIQTDPERFNIVNIVKTINL